MGEAEVCNPLTCGCPAHIDTGPQNKRILRTTETAQWAVEKGACPHHFICGASMCWSGWGPNYERILRSATLQRLVTPMKRGDPPWGQDRPVRPEVVMIDDPGEFGTEKPPPSGPTEFMVQVRVLAAVMKSRQIIEAVSSTRRASWRLTTTWAPFKSGKIADIVIVDVDLLDDLSVLENVVMVVHDGKVACDRTRGSLKLRAARATSGALVSKISPRQGSTPGDGR